ncbi:MAG TPA: hypothetical protein VFV50_12410 [Bdellovibrionales bacterium]|nr:hypothetical protein [Bdellovibrionales bacterium]
MGRCETCGNDYDKTFEIHRGQEVHTFDSFECAIHLMAPKCEHCGCRVLGHGVEVGEEIFCCANCSEAAGRSGIRDRVQLGSAELA